ncbi:MAG TPA: RNA methyltransferase [bacterium]|nr:RNA methyltransferase [bacterium]
MIRGPWVRPKAANEKYDQDGGKKIIGKLKPLKWYSGLHRSKGRREAGVFLVEGERAIKQVMAFHRDRVLEIVTSNEDSKVMGAPVRYVTPAQFRSISSMKTPQGVMAVVRLPDDTDQKNLPSDPGTPLLLMEDIQDPGNVGTLIRTAAAFGFQGILMTDKCADPFGPRAVQAGAGTVLNGWIRRHADIWEGIGRLKKQGYVLGALDPGGEEGPDALREEGHRILALGNEAGGLSGRLKSTADLRIHIPINRRAAESLNVAVSGAIAMYLMTKAEKDG